MQPEIHLGPLTLQTFGIMFALAFNQGAGVRPPGAMSPAAVAWAARRD